MDRAKETLWREDPCKREVSGVLSLQVLIQNESKETFIGPKIRSPKARDGCRQINESVARSQPKCAQRGPESAAAAVPPRGARPDRQRATHPHAIPPQE